MSTRRPDYEPFERTWLAEASDQVEALRRARSGCPSARLLMADRADALPEDLHAAVSAHVANCAACRSLIAALDDLQAPAGATPEETRRILRRVKQTWRAGGRSSPAGARWIAWRPALAATALLGVAAVFGWQYSRESVQPPPGPASPRAAVSTPLPANPESILGLDKPPVRMSLALLTWRGEGDQETFLSEIAPALDAYRSNRYRDAAERFSALAVRYPRSLEVAYYLGVSRLLLGDSAGATAALAAAAALGDDGTFGYDIAWHLALARARAGQADIARRQFTGLCAEPNPYRDRACAATAALSTPRRPR